jgi:hypothetical protein
VNADFNQQRADLHLRKVNINQCVFLMWSADKGGGHLDLSHATTPPSLVNSVARVGDGLDLLPSKSFSYFENKTGLRRLPADGCRHVPE